PTLSNGCTGRLATGKSPKTSSGPTTDPPFGCCRRDPSPACRATPPRAPIGSPSSGSNANLKDALPGVLSPLGWSMSLSVIRYNLFAPHRAAGYEIPPGLEVCRRFSGRAYFDRTSLFWAFYDGLGLTAAEFNRSLGGHQPELPVDEPHPMKAKRARRRGRARPPAPDDSQVGQNPPDRDPV